MVDKELIRETAENELKDSSMFLVDITILPGNKIIVEIDSDTAIGIDDCIAISKKIESSLDRDIEDFELEVGSAGLTAPFKLPRQYEKNIGNEIEVLTQDGKKLFGVLKSCDSEKFIVTIERQEKPEGAKRKITVEEDLEFSYSEVKHTKYSFRFK